MEFIPVCILQYILQYQSLVSQEKRGMFSCFFEKIIKKWLPPSFFEKKNVRDRTRHRTTVHVWCVVNFPNVWLWGETSLDRLVLERELELLYYESIKRELKTKLIYECRCHGRPGLLWKTKRGEKSEMHKTFLCRVTSLPCFLNRTTDNICLF